MKDGNWWSSGRGANVMYGAKAQRLYYGNAAGRPLINAVGKRVWLLTAPPWITWLNLLWPAIL